MPTIDLGLVRGPQGPQGETGPRGAQGDPGPNSIGAETGTLLTGVLAGSGGNVTTKTVDSAPDASHTDNLISSAAVAKQILWYSGQAVSAASNAQICRVPASGTDSAITADHVVSEVVWGNPAAIAGNVTWTTYAGYVAFTGTCTAATTVAFQLSKKGN